MMIPSALLLTTAIASIGSAYPLPLSPPPASSTTRQAFLSKCSSAIASTPSLQGIFVILASPSPAHAESKAGLQRAYRKRIAADIRDFNALGAAIDRGETDGDAWVGFFLENQGRDDRPDGAGRTHAGALADFTGSEDDGAGCGSLLASSYGSEPSGDTLPPSMKRYNDVATAFEPIRIAGKKGDAAQAKVAWASAGDLLSEYLKVVGMQDVLSVPMYN